VGEGSEEDEEMEDGDGEGGWMDGDEEGCVLGLAGVARSFLGRVGSGLCAYTLTADCSRGFHATNKSFTCLGLALML
jgi:hypothetical protein